MVDLSFFFFVGIFHLSFMAYTDIKKMKIDSRHNYFMFGMVAALYVIVTPSLFYLGSLFLVTLIIVLSSSKLLASGDLNALAWIILGCGLISLPKLFIFFYFYYGILAIYLIVKQLLLYNIPVHVKQGIRTPGLPVLWGAFLLASLVKA